MVNPGSVHTLPFTELEVPLVHVRLDVEKSMADVPKVFVYRPTVPFNALICASVRRKVAVVVGAVEL